MQNKSRGITLIALVITIIVLLILAGVSIAMLTGENGILTQANEAKEATSRANAEEKVKLAVQGSWDTNGKMDYNLLKDNLNTIENIEGVPNSITDTDFPLIVTVDGEKVTIKNDGTTILGEWTPGQPNNTGIFTENSTINGNAATASNPTIPAGFKPINTETSNWREESGGPLENDVEAGLVITDGNSEFVWVPVKNVLANTEEEANQSKAMAINLGNSNNPIYRGILYNFTDTGSSVINSCTTTDTANREPTDIEVDQGYEEFQKIDLQSEYNLMIESIRKYGGFYIGRYETSINEELIAQSKANMMPINASQDSNYMWYGLYNKLKDYANANKLNSVVSGMIWGSQYDAMINWIYTGGDKEKLLNGNNGNHNSTSAVETGSYENGKDKLNNIYDLEGNVFEWTLEASNEDKRIARGGSYTISRVASHRLMSNWYDITPDATFDYYSSRIMLYIK